MSTMNESAENAGHEPEERARRPWVVPVTSLILGVLMLVAAGLNGEWGVGAAMLGIMAVYAVVLVVFRRSEPIALLASENNDERQQQVYLRAAAFSLNLVALVSVAGFLVEIARGNDATPWVIVCAAGGLSFIGAVVYQSRRG